MAGYNPPTNDPINVLAARNQALEAAKNEALRAVGTQPFQAVKKLARQVEILQEQQEMLQQQQTQLQQQQTQLQQQQTQLTGVVQKQGEILSQLQAVVAQIVVPQSDSNSTSSAVTVTSGWANFASVSFKVPSGYTKAAVIAIGSALIGTSVVNLRVAIGGSVGETVGIIALEVGSSTSVGHATTLTGLSGGQTFSVRCQAQAPSGNTVARFATAAQVIFLR